MCPDGNDQSEGFLIRGIMHESLSKGRFLATRFFIKRFVDIMLRTMASEENNDCLRPIRAKHFYNISSIAMAEV